MEDDFIYVFWYYQAEYGDMIESPKDLNISITYI